MKNNYPNLMSSNGISFFVESPFCKKLTKQTILIALFLILFGWNKSYSQFPGNDNIPGVAKTYTIPAGVTSVTASTWGAGGGGGGSSATGTGGNGGGGGGAATRVIPVTGGTLFTYTVGTGGSAGAAAGGAGGNGGLSSITCVTPAISMTTNGGTGGLGNAAVLNNPTNSGGGTASGGTTNSSGSLGTRGGASGQVGGNSGTVLTIFGAGGTPAVTNIVGNPGINPGGGGGGGEDAGGGSGDRAGAIGGAGRVAFQFIRVTGIAPNPVCVGSTITITGANFASGGSTVSINGTACTSVTWVSATSITAVVANGTTTGTVLITNPNGTNNGQSITVNAQPADPANPTSNSPQCVSPGVTLTRTGTPPVSETWYWQTTALGTTTTDSGATYVVTISGTYYIRARNNTTGCWSASSGSLAVVVNSAPSSAPITPSPATAATNICYSGSGPLTSISWAATVGATSYDVYFGAGSLPGSVTATVATNSYSIGTLLASTTYYWRVVPKNTCGSGPTSSTWTFTTKAGPCYCIPTGSGTVDGNGITKVVYSSVSNTTTGTTVYNDYSATQIGNVIQGAAMPIAVTTSTGTKEYNIYIYVDWNNDTDFDDSGETVFTGKVKTNTINGVINVSLAATTGYHTMRIGIAKKSNGANEIPTPCYNGDKVAYEDYTLNVTAAAGCSGAPTITTNPVNVTIANGGSTSFTATFGNLPTSFYWEVSTDGGGNYTTITNSGVYSNATTSTLNLTAATISMNGYIYRITATNACGNVSSTSNATLSFSTTYCAPTHILITHWISRVFSDGNLKDTSYSGAPAMSTNGIADYNNIVIGRQSPGGGLNISFELGSTSAGPSANRSRVAAWVDWNGNNVFDATEKIYTTLNFGVLEATFGIVVPITIAPGNYRLRIRTRNTGEVTDPCAATGVAGEIEDYTISIVSDCAAEILTVTDGETCGVNNPVTMRAQGLGGTTEYRWYTTLKGGTAEAVTTIGEYSPVLAATKIYYVTAFNGSCETLVRKRIKATITPAANIIFDPAEPKTCEEETIITISAASDFTEIELFYEDFENATIGLTATMPYSYNPGADSPWQVKESTYQPSTTDAWKPATNSGANENLFGFSTSDYFQAKIQTRYTTTSSFNTTDFVSLALDFSMYYSHYGRVGEDFKVQISDDGSTWNDLVTYNSDQGFASEFKAFTITVPTTYLDKTTVSLRFQYTSGDLACVMPSSCGWSDGVAIDDIRFYGIKELNTTFVWTSPPAVPVAGFLDQACTIPYAGELLSKIYLRPTLTQLEATQFPITVIATLGNGCPITQVIDVINNARVWKGLDVVDATTWNDVDNWKPASVPTIESCVIIPNNSIVKGTNFQGYAKNVVVKSTGNLNVLSGNSVTVKEWVHVDTGGVFELENNSGLVQIDNVASNNNLGEIRYKRNSTVRRYDYIYFSSPVEGYTVNSITQSPYTTGPIYKWNPTVANPNNGQGNWEDGSGNTMEVGKGYAVRSPNNFPTAFTTYYGLFQGRPSNGIITVPVSRGSDQNASYHAGLNGVEITNFSDNWNLIGNPYPSSVRGSQFLFDNRTKIEGNIRIWTHATLPSSSQAQPFYGSFGANYAPNDYLTYNFTGTSCCPLAAADIFVGAGQGFFVQMKDGPATSDVVTFNNTTRGDTYTNSYFFKDGNPSTAPNTEDPIDVNNLQRNRYWLDLVNPANQSTRLLVGNIEGATNDRDSFYDANADTSGSFTFYSLIGIAKFLIQGRAVNFDIFDEVPLGIKVPSAGTYSIAISAVDGYFVEKNIIVKDMLLNTFHDLKISPYQFTSAAGQFDNRFKIVYYNSTLSNEDFDYDNSVKVVTNDAIEVQSTKETIETIVVYDILGRTLGTYNKINANEFTIRNLLKTNTTLLLQIKLQNGVIVNEKIIY